MALWLRSGGADVVTPDSDTDSDDGEYDPNVQTLGVGSHCLRVLSLHAPCAITNRLLSSLTLRLIPAVDARQMYAHDGRWRLRSALSSGSCCVYSEPYGAFQSVLHDATLRRCCPPPPQPSALLCMAMIGSLGLRLLPSFLAYPSSDLGKKVEMSKYERVLQPGERLVWHHEHWDQAFLLQVQLEGFRWSDHVPLDRAATGERACVAFIGCYEVFMVFKALAAVVVGGCDVRVRLVTLFCSAQASTGSRAATA